MFKLPVSFLILALSLIFVSTLSIIQYPQAFADTVTVSIPSGTGIPSCEKTNSCYDPSGMLVQKGDSVKWINHDTAAHTVTSGNPTDGPDGLFNSGHIMGNYDYSFKFTETGNYDYFCILHPWMQGNIVVFDISEDEDNYTPPPQSNNYPTKNNNDYDEDSRINIILSNRIETLNYELQNLKTQLEAEKIRADMLAVDKGRLNIMYDELESESDQMRQTISEQKDTLMELKEEIKSLKALVMEQLTVLNDLFLKLSS